MRCCIGPSRNHLRRAPGTVGIITALADNVANNLPVGLVAGSVASADHLPSPIVSAMLIGVDLGPNLSVTGSLATILWLVALRRKNVEITAWRFLKRTCDATGIARGTRGRDLVSGETAKA
jgi:Na+/H+ antiporter NhaD/arsenite permease-like protein